MSPKNGGGQVLLIDAADQILLASEVVGSIDADIEILLQIIDSVLQIEGDVEKLMVVERVDRVVDVLSALGVMAEDLIPKDRRELLIG